MKKFVNSDDAFAIIDKLFANIQKNRYTVNQEMLNEAWNAWVSLPNAFNTFEVVEKLTELVDKSSDGKLSLKEVLEVLSDEEKNGDSRMCKFCGKSRKETIVFPVNLNGERIYTCQKCISKQKNIKQIGFNLPLDDINPDADKRILLYAHFLKPEIFGNAEYAQVKYTCEKEIDIRCWEVKARIDFIANALGLEENDVYDILKDDTNSRFKQCKEIYDSIEFVSKEEYNKR